jgi:acetyl esterase
MATDYDELREERMAALDDEMKAVWDVRQHIGKGLREIGVETMRKALDGAADAAGPLREGVRAETIAVPGPAGPVLTRVYRPEGITRPGLYVHTHAGGFVAMNGLDHVDGMNSATALGWGCAVVHPDFRVPPENRFPAAIEDCWGVLQWVSEHADDLDVDRERIAVGGGCTGANIAAVMALMARDAGAPKITLQLLFSPQLDCRQDYRSYFELADGYGLTRDSARWVVEQYFYDRANRWDWRASPVLAETVRGVAPALFSVGEWEILRDETALYANRLRDAGVKVHYLEGDQQGHGYLQWVDPRSGNPTRIAAEHNAEITRIVRSCIGPDSAG